MKIEKQNKNKINNRAKRIIVNLIKPIIPFLLFILIIIFLVCYLFDGMMKQAVEYDDSYLTEEEKVLKNLCIEQAENANTCNNFVNGNKTNELLDSDNREESKKLEWSPLYMLYILEDTYYNPDEQKEKVKKISDYFKSTFKYETFTIKTENKVNENGTEKWNLSSTETKYLLTECDTIYGHFIFNYEVKELYSNNGNTKITDKVFVDENIQSEAFARLRTYLKNDMGIKDDEIDIYVNLVMESSNGYYEGENLKIDTSKVLAAKGMFLWPIPGYTTITSKFGYRIHPLSGKYKLHAGIDVGAPTGANFVAAADGTVESSVFSSSYGNMIMINHGNGIHTLYAHGSERLVKTNQFVKAGTPVLKVGSTGNSTGPHAHFEIRIGNKYADPLEYYDLGGNTE